MVLKKALPSALDFSGLAPAQGTIDTYAGNNALFEGSGQPTTAAQLAGPNNCVVDRQGTVYISASGLSMVLKVTAATGVITVFAGDSLNFAGDGGLAASASLAYPQGLALDSAGNLYIADQNDSNIGKARTNGIITTAAGDSGQGGFRETEDLQRKPSSATPMRSPLTDPALLHRGPGQPACPDGQRDVRLQTSPEPDSAFFP